MDIVQNSIVAEATEIVIIYDKSSDSHLEITIKDNGKGMDEEQVKSAVNPFFTTRTTRNIGLGIPLFKMSAEKTGGNFDLTSEKGKGTQLVASFNTQHIDMVPLGDTISTIFLVVTGNPNIDFLFQYNNGSKSFKFDTKEIKEILDGIPINSPEITTWLSEYLKEGLGSIN